MSHPILTDAQAKMKKAVDYTLHEFSSIHTGKATPAANPASAKRMTKR